MNSSQPQKSIHFNGLNGIRAICALSVVISHTSLSLSMIGITAGGIFGLAAYGVTAFFALSGFLITYLLIEEKETHNDISVKKFYIRRVLRIWPLYFGYMAIAILVDVFVLNAHNFSSIGFYVFFFPNIPFSYELVGLTTVVSIPLLGHFWSLGVEEQFYAFYPWIVKIFKNLLLALIGMFILVLVIKGFSKYLSYKTGNPFWYSWADNTRFDAMALGGIGAWVFKNKTSLVIQIVNSKILQIVFALVLIMVFTNRLLLPNTISHMVVAGVTVLAIYYAHLFNRPLINVRNRYIDYLGKISFGIYVYHPLIIALSALIVAKFGISAPIKVALFFFFVVIFTILLASLSYRYFEKYFLKLKYNYAVVKSKD